VTQAPAASRRMPSKNGAPSWMGCRQSAIIFDSSDYGKRPGTPVTQG
jgi:hypothetical protein